MAIRILKALETLTYLHTEIYKSRDDFYSSLLYSIVFYILTSLICTPSTEVLKLCFPKYTVRVFLFTILLEPFLVMQ